MNHQKIILFDFDGVIINGIEEYWISSVLACQKYLLPNSSQINGKKNKDFFKTFIEIRPWVKYGWEMVLITHEILRINNPLNHSNKDRFLEKYEENCLQILKDNCWESKTLQACLDEARTFQIKNDFKKWISLHKPYIEVLSFIKKAINQGFKIGIISTKGEVFTSKILNNINICPHLIFGYESGTKVEIISKLSLKYDIKGFIEDRKKTLISVLENKETKNINCYLADWGYLQKTDKINLNERIKLLKLRELEDILAN